ncbi:hypothetical protein SDJN02_26199, partial [Cucurbita argyrosperma subsp. argyrosperma]
TEEHREVCARKFGVPKVALTRRRLILGFGIIGASLCCLQTQTLNELLHYMLFTSSNLLPR